MVKPMRMHHPPYPGETLRELCLEPLNLSVTEAAESLGVSRNTLSAILNGRAGISPEMAIRLSRLKTSSIGCSIGSWRWKCIRRMGSPTCPAPSATTCTPRFTLRLLLR